MLYDHTQAGYLIRFVLLAVVLLFGIVLKQTGFNIFVVAEIFFILLLVASFMSLKVMIDENFLRIQFGYGIFRKRFKLKEIVLAKTVQNHWYNGWGIRLWLWPYRWTFNVSGFDAVEIKMRNGRIYRIGTDEPKKLEQAIKQVIK